MFRNAAYAPANLAMTVADLMTFPVRTCAPEDSLKHVMAVMTRSRIRHLPVVNERGLGGILSVGDVVKRRLQEMELEVNVLRDSCMAGRLGAIS